MKVEFTKKFRKEYGFAKIKYNTRIKHIVGIFYDLARGKIIDSKYKDHQLKGNLKDFRECHVLFDLLLVYKIETGKNKIIFHRLSSHSELFY